MNNFQNKPDMPEDEIHFLDYLIVLAKYSRMIVYTTVAVFVLVYLAGFVSPAQYTATARLLPPQENLSLSGQLLEIMGGGVKPGAGGMGSLSMLFGMKSPGDLYVGMLTSDTVLTRIIERFNLKELYKKKTLEDTRGVLKKRSKVAAGKKDTIITIEVTDKSARRAADLANGFIEELEKLLQGLAVQEASSRLAFLEKELKTADQNLVKAEEVLRSFSEKNSVIQIDTQTRGMLHYIAQLRAEIDAKEVQVQVLRQQATPYNYDVVRVETEIKGLKDKLRAAEKQWDQSCIGDVCLSTSKMPTLGLEYVRLYRDVRYQETLYQLFTKMVEMARLDLVKDVAVIQVVDRASPPDKRSNKRLLPAVLAGVVVFFLLILAAFIMEYVTKMEQDTDSAKKLALLTANLRRWKIWQQR